MSPDQPTGFMKGVLRGHDNWLAVKFFRVVRFFTSLSPSPDGQVRQRLLRLLCLWYKDIPKYVTGIENQNA
jgi:hypothetical protein